MNPTNSQSASPPPPLNLPCQDLLDEGSKEDYHKICFPLYEASMKGDWKAATNILDKKKCYVRFSINRNNETALHVAAYKGHTPFVKKLVILMNKEDLELQNNSYNTALCIAAIAGHVAVAKIIVTMQKALINIAGSQGMMPLHMAALSGKHDMVKYLYEESDKMTGWTNENQSSVLLACVEAELYDVAQQIVKDCPGLAKSGGGTLLRVLARKPHAFKTKPTAKETLRNNLYSYSEFIKYLNKFIFDHHLSTCTWTKYHLLCILVYPFITVKGLGGEKHQALQLFRIIWEIIEKLSKAEIDDILRGPGGSGTSTTPKYSSRLLFLAAEMGNAEFIVELVRKYPERVLELNDNNQSIFHIAILHRHTNIFPLLYEMGSIKESIINLEDINGNNMLHLVGIMEKTSMCKQFEDMSQVYLQMEEELIWFKKVDATLPPSLRLKKNKVGESPRELFIKNHKDLVSNGQEWMKKTFSELLLLAALMITISFAAAISFASESNQDTPDTANYKSTYNVFMFYNGLSFLTASVSIISMLSIIGSRYAEHDFLESLHGNLGAVIVVLCSSMFFMILAFSMIIILLYREDYPWVAQVVKAHIYVVSILFVYGMLTHTSSWLAYRFKMRLLHNKRIMY